jgi:hypothetical protein
MRNTLFIDPENACIECIRAIPPTRSITGTIDWDDITCNFDEQLYIAPSSCISADEFKPGVYLVSLMNASRALVTKRLMIIN